MELYIADIGKLKEESIYRHMSCYITEERLERIARYRSEADRARGLGAGLLLEYGLRKRGLTLLDDVPGCRKVPVEKGMYGKPYVSGEQDLCFNLSHAGDYAVAVFAGSEVGVDIERIRRIRRRLAERFFAEAECRYLDRFPDGEAQDTAFTWIWTRKESYIKAAGEGMHLPLDAFCVLGERVCRQSRSGGRPATDAGCQKDPRRRCERDADPEREESDECAMEAPPQSPVQDTMRQIRCICGACDRNEMTGYELRTWELPDGYRLSVCAEPIGDVSPEKVDLSQALEKGLTHT